MTDVLRLPLQTVTEPGGRTICWAGLTTQGQAFLLGDHYDDSVAIWFDDQGAVKEVRQLTPDAHSPAEQPDAPAWPPPDERLRRWREELGLREAAIWVQPFQLRTHRIAVVAGPPDVPAGQPHHSLWWQREYWLDETGRFVGLGREDPDLCPADLLFQLRLSEPAPTEAERAVCVQLADKLRRFSAGTRLGQVSGPEWGRGVATFTVLGLIGRQWTDVANEMHVWLGEHGLLESAREVLRSHFRYADGREEIEYQVLWPKGFQGEISLTTW